MSVTYTRTVDHTERLDLYLRRLVPQCLPECTDEVSRSKIRRLIIAGAVRVNSRQCRIPSFMLSAGSSIAVVLDETRFFQEKQPDDIVFEVTAESVLYEDDVLIVINKPAFFPTEATIVGRRDNLHDAVVRYLWKQHPDLRNPPYVGIMHRLDRETSGVILFTKQRTVNAAVHNMFEQHTARKVYRAVTVCPSVPPPYTFNCDNFIGRISSKSSAAQWGAVPERSGGVHAHTDFIVIGNGVLGCRRVLFIEAHPLTGRTHQIRVHLSEKGLPIAGDQLYGGPEADRIMLHAQMLTFPHPVTGMVMTVEAPLPPGFSC